MRLSRENEKETALMTRNPQGPSGCSKCSSLKASDRPEAAQLLLRIPFYAVRGPASNTYSDLWALPSDFGLPGALTGAATGSIAFLQTWIAGDISTVVPFR